GFTDAVLTENIPANSPAYGIAGNRLPNSPRLSGNLSTEQEFSLWGRTRGYFGGTLTYAGERVSVFTGTPVRTICPSDTKLDLRSLWRSDSWSALFYVNNVTDERGNIGGVIGYQPSYAFVYIQPRTFGITISRAF